MKSDDLSPEQRLRVRKIVADMLGVELAKVPHDIEREDFLADLGLDSLDVVELLLELEEEID